MFFSSSSAIIVFFSLSSNVCQVKTLVNLLYILCTFVSLFLWKLKPKARLLCGKISLCSVQQNKKKPHTLEIAAQKVNSHFLFGLFHAHIHFITRSIPTHTYTQHTHTHTNEKTSERCFVPQAPLSTRICDGTCLVEREYKGEIVFVQRFTHGHSNIQPSSAVYHHHRSVCMCLSLSACCFLLLSKKRNEKKQLHMLVKRNRRILCNTKHSFDSEIRLLDNFLRRQYILCGLFHLSQPMHQPK